MMNVIIAAKFLRAPKKLAFDQPKVAGIALGAIFLVLATAFGAGYLTRGANGAALEEIARMQAQLDAQSLELAQARDEAQREVNAIAARVGELQAQANRLNALGDRLTRVGKLKDGEFNFGELPGQGGGESAGDVPSGDLLSSLDQLQSQFDQSGRQLNVLEALLFDQTLDSNSTPAGMPAPGYISSRYGGRNDPFGRGRAHHQGIDIDANSGDPVTAAAEGVVSFSGVRGGYGNVVEIDHGNGYKTLYAHNSANLVKAGDVVRAGQRIAKVGSTGRSTGSHLHFEVQLNGRQVNPRQYLEKVRG
jgi:murein DD-endopeptidase MepM/ murein hydrolase activator NlpD